MSTMLGDRRDRKGTAGDFLARPILTEVELEELRCRGVGLEQVAIVSWYLSAHLEELARRTGRLAARDDTATGQDVRPMSSRARWRLIRPE